MAQADHELLRTVLAHVRQSHPDLCRQWFEDIDPVSMAGGVFRLRAPQEMHHRYLTSRCLKAFNDAAQSATEHLTTVEFLKPDEPDRPPPQARGNVEVKSGASPEAGPRPRRVHTDELPLISDYTFDQFVVGPSNRLAHAAASAIGDKPGQAYNPMFIHGDVGLGKTHLLQAICMRILEVQPGARIVYISCDGFIDRFMEAVQAGEMRDFRNSFRDADALILDDIQFLTKSNKSDLMQEEFFHTFNSLYQSDRQIVLSSDSPPDDIPDLERRLISRFKWGMVAKIERPDYETRVAIVKQKARIRAVDLPDEVAAIIASSVDSNIRELEGALTKIQLQAQVDGTEITPEIAREALGVAALQTSAQVTIETIVEAITDFFNVSLSALQSKRRQRSIAQPRQVCMYLARKYTRYSLEEIGGYFGGRDHTTVLHGVKAISHLRQSNPDMDRTIAAIEAKLSGESR